MNRQTIYRAAAIGAVALALILTQLGGWVAQNQFAVNASYPHLDSTFGQSGEELGTNPQVSLLDDPTPTPTPTQPSTESEPGGSGGGGGGG